MNNVLKYFILGLFVCLLSGCIQLDPDKIEKDGKTYYQAPFGWQSEVNQLGTPQQKDLCDVSFLSKLANFLINPITKQIQIIAIEIFENIVTSGPFKHWIHILLTLYVVIYGVMFSMSMIQETAKTFVVRIVKIGVVLALLSGTSYNFFKEYLFDLFINGSNQLIDVFANPGCDTTQEANYFSFVNYIINLFASSGIDIWLLLSSLLVAFPIGWLMLGMFIYVIYHYFLAAIKALIAYLVAFTAIGFLIALGPLFIILILFEKTQSYFKAWLSMLVAFSMEPVILFACITLITLFINDGFQALFAFNAYWEYIGLELHLKFSDDVIIDIAPFMWYVPDFYTDFIHSGVDFATTFLNRFAILLAIFIFVKLFSKVQDLASMFATALFGGVKGASSMETAGAVISNIGKSTVGQLASGGAKFVGSAVKNKILGRSGGSDKSEGARRSGV